MDRDQNRPWDEETHEDSTMASPLTRLSLTPHTALADAYLVGPLVAIVESGSLAVQLGVIETTDDPGQRLEVADGIILTARNKAATDATQSYRRTFDFDTLTTPFVVASRLR